MMYYNAECCKHCSNNPANNPFASGWCACTLPYMEQYKTPIDTIDTKTYTYQTSDWSNIVNINENKYRRKSTEIEAIQWTGDNYVDICLFMGREVLRDENVLHIDTIHKPMNVYIGDYIIKGVNNTFYSCSADVFEKEYEKVGD